jgi:signal transduction histidine kinase
VETQRRVSQQSERLATESALLVGGCLLVALGCAILTVRIAAGVFRRMEWQAGELSRVSFRMLETQESTARRFSHELHDELGGSLTAIKSNLGAIAADPANRGRIEDCVKLVESSISNVRELSQLLRPTILDDFGLDAGIRWLAGRFRERTHIEVDYQSSFDGRLADETETHLFRIVQEALTNIARHSGATRVSIHLRADDDAIRLTIADNGRGFKKDLSSGSAVPVNGNPGKSGPVNSRPVKDGPVDDGPVNDGPVNGGQTGRGGMGLTGMRARARSAGGELKLTSAPGCGVTIEVWAPLAAPAPRERA